MVDYDEEHCWQLEIHQCNENEYQCSNGQCIPKAFFRDDSRISDCIDQLDSIDYVEYYSIIDSRPSSREPTFLIEDMSCIIMNHVMGTENILSQVHVFKIVISFITSNIFD